MSRVKPAALVLNVNRGTSLSRRATRLWWLLMLGALASAAPAAATADSGTRTMAQSYVVGDPAPMPGMTGLCGERYGAVNVAAVCFGPTHGDVVTLTIEDDSGLPVGADAYVRDDNGVMAFRQFCGSSGPIAAEPGWLVVYLDTAGERNPGCPLGSSAGATTGDVRATFEQVTTP